VAIIKSDVVGVAAYQLLLIDNHERPDGNDGFLTLREIQAYRVSLEEERDEYARTHFANSFLKALEARVVAARELERTTRSAEQWMDDVHIQYLPDELAKLELRLRRRAIDILRHDDKPPFDCHINQIMLQKAWDRYQMTGASTALAEVAAIGIALGLKMPR